MSYLPFQQLNFSERLRPVVAVLCLMTNVFELSWSGV